VDDSNQGRQIANFQASKLDGEDFSVHHLEAEDYVLKIVLPKWDRLF
jgi:hypothetical protein